MVTTSPDNLWSPNATDPYNLSTDLATMQTSVQAALTNRPKTYRTDLTDAQRLALSGAERFEGLRVRTTDTKLDWVFTGGSWVRETPQHAVASYASSGSHNVNPAAISIRTGLISGTTSSAGVLSHTFSLAFDTACIAVLFMPNQTQGSTDPVVILGGAGGITRTGFSTFWPGQPSLSRSLPYIAFGF